MKQFNTAWERFADDQAKLTEFLNAKPKAALAENQVQNTYDIDTPSDAAKMRGHYAYYGISGNFRRLSWYAHKVARIWHKWLSRRGSRFTWDRFNDLLTRHPLPAARIVHRYAAVSESLP